MSRVLAVVEGQTELAFVEHVLRPELEGQGVFVQATMVGKPGAKGGARCWSRVRGDILKVMKQDRDVYCTTMFDYYALPRDWPSRSESPQPQGEDAAISVEQGMRSDISAELGDSFDPRRFLPYIQLHEFEALLFSDTAVLADVLQVPGSKEMLDGIVSQCGSPEEVDDDPATAPSKRILSICSSYEKIAQGTRAAKDIGIGQMRRSCPHFDGWLTGLEQLG
jgi:hypothetical protein